MKSNRSRHGILADDLAVAVNNSQEFEDPVNSFLDGQFLCIFTVEREIFGFYELLQIS